MKNPPSGVKLVVHHVVAGALGYWLLFLVVRQKTLGYILVIKQCIMGGMEETAKVTGAGVSPTQWASQRMALCSLTTDMF